MPMDFEDFVAIADAGEIRPTRDGYLVAAPRVARTGIQVYRGSELGRPDLASVRVYRPESEVFSEDSLRSFAFRPITNDHPPEPVRSTNWKRYSVGNTDGTIARDGQFIRVPMMLADQGAIEAWKAGKTQLSVGYTADVKWGDGVTPDGEQYDAMQTTIRANHIALVKAARGGPKLSIGDAGASVNSAGVSYGRQLVRAGKVNTTAPWSFDANDGDRALGPSGNDWVEYGRDFLAVDASADPETKDHYHYPFAKGGVAYRSGVAAAKDRAAQQGEGDIESAADRLLQQIDSKATGDRDMNEKTTTIADIDGVKVEMTDIAHSVVTRRIKGLEDALGTAETKSKADAETAKAATGELQKKFDEATKAGETKDAEIATLKQQLKDAELTPAKLDTAVKDRSIVVGKAKAVLGDKLVSDGKTDGEVMRQVVAAKMGDACKDWKDEQVKASFDTLTAGVKGVDALAGHLSGNRAQDNAPEREKPYLAYDAKVSERWKGPQAKTA